MLRGHGRAQQFVTVSGKSVDGELVPQLRRSNRGCAGRNTAEIFFAGGNEADVSSGATSLEDLQASSDEIRGGGRVARRATTRRLCSYSRTAS